MLHIALLEQGAVVVTAGRRLARVLTESFSAAQHDRGRALWKTPLILPWDSYLQRLWRDGMMTAPDLPVLLNEQQELALWDGIIRRSAKLLEFDRTARNARNAWRLAHAWRLPLSAGGFGANEDCEAFLAWAREFERRCSAGTWIDYALVSDRLVELFESGSIERPAALLVAGFDELSPQQERFLEAAGGAEELPMPEIRATVACLKLRDAHDEIHEVARWARRTLEHHPEARIGVVAPDLQSQRSKIERAFTVAGLDRAFHISLGPPLGEYPLIATALLILDVCRTTKIPLETMGLLLRSPFLAGAAIERSSRALLDQKLRRWGGFHVSLISVEAAAGDCTHLVRLLQSITREEAEVSAEQCSSQWSATFSRLLRAAGWPGDRTLDSVEYQTRHAWNELLSSFATLDAVCGLTSFETALRQLRDLAANRLFQPENEGAPIQILGMNEAAGLEFDHLRVIGLTDEAFPPPAHANPFLPVALQRKYRLPHASAARELESARRVLQRLTHSAREVLLTCAEVEGDRKLGPSPLLPEKPVSPHRLATGPNWIEQIRAAAILEEITDVQAPALNSASPQPGGTRLLADMAACAFRAFARHRLGARELDEPELGIRALDKGVAVHEALCSLWRHLKTHAALCDLSAEELLSLVARSVRGALEKRPDSLGRRLEQLRLEKLLSGWLEIERLRSPFTVIETEAKHDVTIGGLQLVTRIDRVDELPDGRHIIFDYKTGDVKLKSWDGDRPDEPQVPLYCATNSGTIAGAAFAQVRNGSLGFKGILTEGIELPEVKEMKVEGKPELDQLIADWRRVLGHLAEDFRAGRASVNHKKGACAYCKVTALCRIREIESIDLEQVVDA